jgi:hypothetical protein
MVLPRALREEIVSVPGEVLVRHTDGGLLLTTAESDGLVHVSETGVPSLTLGRRVTNSEVLRAIDQDRADR